MGDQIDSFGVETGKQSKGQSKDNPADRDPEDITAEKIENDYSSQKRKYRPRRSCRNTLRAPHNVRCDTAHISAKSSHKVKQKVSHMPQHILEILPESRKDYHVAR